MTSDERRANVEANKRAVAHAVRVREVEGRLRPDRKRFDERPSMRPARRQKLSQAEHDALTWLAVLLVALVLLRG